MWWRRSFLAAGCLAILSCAFGESEFPEDAVTFNPPPEFRVWWEVVEGCSRQRRDFDDVTWFKAPELSIRDRTAFGVWSAALNRIALRATDQFDGGIVRHEILHALLRSGGHPDAFFKGACGDMVACGRDCPSPEIPPDPVAIGLDELDVGLRVYPEGPSLTRHHGRLSVVLSVRNTKSANTYIESRSIGQTHCTAGVILVSVSDPSRTAMVCTFGGLPRVFRGNETRHVVLDVQLQQLGPGNGPFFAEALTVGAVLGDNVRRITTVHVRP